MGSSYIGKALQSLFNELLKFGLGNTTSEGGVEWRGLDLRADRGSPMTPKSLFSPPLFRTRRQPWLSCARETEGIGLFIPRSRKHSGETHCSLVADHKK
jgi:hypothetical protein